MSRKPRIDEDGPSALQRLKSLPWEEVEFLLAQREQLSSEKLIAQISSRHGIAPISPQRLSDFWRWADSQRAIQQMNADAEQFRTEFIKEGIPASAEEIHIRTVDYMRLKGIREDNNKMLAYAVTEARKAIELEHSARKLALLEQKAAQALETVEDSKLSDAQKADRIREIFKK